jgi:hypothetical protein
MLPRCAGASARDPVARPGNGHRSSPGPPARDDSETRPLLGDGVRLAQSRSEIERSAEFRNRNRWAGHSLHSRSKHRNALPLIVAHGPVAVSVFPDELYQQPVSPLRRNSPTSSWFSSMRRASATATRWDCARGQSTGLQILRSAWLPISSITARVGSAKLGGARVSQTHPLQQGREGRASCGLGAAEDLFGRSSCSLQVAALARSRQTEAPRAIARGASISRITRDQPSSDLATVSRCTGALPRFASPARARR